MMAKAQLCPVCGGTGKYREEKGKMVTCHGCSGRGSIELQEEPPVHIPMVYDHLEKRA